MNWIGLVVALLGVFLVFKVAGALFKLLLWLVILVATYWFVAPYVGLPDPLALLQGLTG